MIFLKIGPIIKEVGIATNEPIIKPLVHAKMKLEEKPIFATVIVNDITKDITNPIKSPETIFLYFKEIFISKYFIIKEGYKPNFL